MRYIDHQPRRRPGSVEDEDTKGSRARTPGALRRRTRQQARQPAIGHPANGTTCPAPSVVAEETYSVAIAFPTAQALVVAEMHAMTTALRAQPD